MTAGPIFSDILKTTAKAWGERKTDACVLSLAVPIQSVDPLSHLPLIVDQQPFRFLWDSAPGLCIAASGECQQFDLSGPRRFELAQRFCDVTLGRLIDVTPDCPEQCRPRLFFAFSFFEQVSLIKKRSDALPAVQAVLPRWQLTRQGKEGWLRLNGVATHEADARELVEQLWLMRERLLERSQRDQLSTFSYPLAESSSDTWKDCYRSALIRGIDLVNEGVLQKLVLAVRHSIVLRSTIEPLAILLRLRQQQQGSCRFLWQRNKDESFFGASPERLLSLRKDQLICDALAGTASQNDSSELLLRSDKDRREHELVVDSIFQTLVREGLDPRRPRDPQLARHGKLVHLHTPVTASNKHCLPLHLAEALHPTPAVAGWPKKEAINWLRTLEPFERGSYAAPIGWIDSLGNAEFRVAIRCCQARGNKLEITAGAGLVRGSIVDKEMKEVGLKLAVLADQFDLITSDL